MTSTKPEQETPTENGSSDSTTASLLSELQEALTKMASESAGAQSVAAVFTGLKDSLSGVNDRLGTLAGNFDMLSNQVSAISDAQNKRIDEVNQKLDLVCQKLNIRIPRPPPVKPAATPAAGKAAPAPTKEPYNPTGPMATLTKKYPDICFIGGGKNPLSPIHYFQFRVGDYTFSSMEHALYYVLFMHMKREDLAVRVKRAFASSDLNAISTDALKEQIEKDPEHLEALKEIFASLFLMRLKQCKEFEEKIQSDEIGNYKSFLYISANKLLGTGCNVAALMSSLTADSYKGSNLYGNCLKDFIDAHRLGFPGGGEPFDVKKYCTYDPVPLSEEKENVLVLGDVQLSTFNERFTTKLVVDHTMSGVTHPKDPSHTAKKVIEGRADLDSYAAVVLLFGTYEVGKSPDKLEADYTELLKYIRDKAPHAAIFVGTALPRTDKFQEQVKLTNYAIGIATRNMDDPRVVLLDIHAKFVALDWKTLMKPNGFQIGDMGVRKLADVLTEMIPFVNLVTPPPPNAKKSFAGKSSARGGASGSGPPSKRGRRSYESGGSYSRFSSYGGGYSQGGSGSAGYSQSATYTGGVPYTPWSVGAVGAAPSSTFQNMYGGGTNMNATFEYAGNKYPDY